MVLWVDSNPNANKILITNIEQVGVNVVNFLTSGELKCWLSNKPVEIVDKILIISNRNRPGDGDECAGVRLCQWVKEEGSEWKDVPFIIYCFLPDLVCDLPKFKDVLLTNDRKEVFKFVIKHLNGIN